MLAPKIYSKMPTKHKMKLKKKRYWFYLKLTTASVLGRSPLGIWLREIIAAIKYSIVLKMSCVCALYCMYAYLSMG
jgi:hypothetical protein